MSEKPLYVADDFADIANRLHDLEAQREMDKIDAARVKLFKFSLECGRQQCRCTWHTPSHDIMWECPLCGSAGAIKWHMPHGTGEWLPGEPSSW